MWIGGGFLTRVIRQIFFLLAYSLLVDAVKCLRNDDIGWREGNIYDCDDPVLTDCCETNGEFTCCETPPIKHFREQIQLWGAVVMFIMMLVVVYVFINRDVQCFSHDTARASWLNMSHYVTFSRTYSLPQQQDASNPGTSSGYVQDVSFKLIDRGVDTIDEERHPIPAPDNKGYGYPDKVFM